MTSLWTRCNSCQRILYKQDILDNLAVCPSCAFHFRISAEERLRMLFDDGAYEVLDDNLHAVDALNFVDTKRYADRIAENEKRTGLSEAIITARGTIGGVPAYILAIEFGFLGGSVASVVGEKIARACERALEDGLPVIIVSYKTNEEDRLQGLAAGADYYLHKTDFDDNSLINAVADLIGEATETQEIS